jgi:ribonuclease HIII
MAVQMTFDMPLAGHPPVPPPKTIHTCPLSLEQVQKLRTILISRGWEFQVRPYMHFFAQRDKLSVAAYEKGPKIVVQGKGVDDFIEFILEPELVGVSAPGAAPAGALENPDDFSPHFGIDESGKGDLFGPLVIAGAYVDPVISRAWQAAGVMDSKKIGTDSKIRQLSRVILQTPGVVQSVLLIGPERYNELYQKFGNLNKLLAWGHARVIENLLEIKPDCPRALSDQFANPRLIQNALLEKGRGIQLDQRTKAESDPAVAAASILARAKFIDWLARESETLGMVLPKGCSAQVKELGMKLVQRDGPQVLAKVAKTHFKTASEILSATSYTQFLLRKGE